MKILVLRSIIILIALFYSVFNFAQSPVTNNLRDEVFEKADQVAVPSGGLTVFYKHLQSNLIYPVSARSSNKEGKVYVSFIVNESGYIESNSVKALVGIDSACDREAVRVIQRYKEKWTPAKVKGRVIKQRVCLPINFVLTDDDAKPDLIIYSLKTIVKTNPAKTSGNKWIVYKDKDMNQRAGSIGAADSVEVIGWAPWLYLIKSKFLSGYVPYRALEITEEMKEIDSLIRKESAALEEKEQHDRSKRKGLSVKSGKDSIVFLGLNITKKELTEGECVPLNLALYVSDKNREPYQFYDLAEQLMTQFYPTIREVGINVTNKIANITGARTQIKNEYYTYYTLYEGALCPTKTVTINPIELKLLHHEKDKKPETGELVSFFSKPITISVKPLPDSINVSVHDLYKMVGKYKVSEEIKTQTISAGAPLIYSLTIKGTGPTALLPAPWWTNENGSVELINIKQQDTIINNSFSSSRTFIYQLTFNKPGNYDFSNTSIHSYFDPEIKAMKMLRGGPKVTVTSSLVKINTLQTLPSIKSNFIVLDISQSMLIEDYKPYRLKAALDGLTDFLSGKSACDIGLILFGGNARPYPLSKNDKCYASEMIDKIDSRMVQNGTAIGDALWLALQSANQSKSKRTNIVIIGDGDNTAGILEIKSSIAFAKKSKIRVNTIGIGTSGLVPFGKDVNGKPNMVDNTFSSVDFIQIAEETGGKYFWAKDAASLSQILKGIFN